MGDLPFKLSDLEEICSHPKQAREAKQQEIQPKTLLEYCFALVWAVSFQSNHLHLGQEDKNYFVWGYIVISTFWKT